MAKMTERSRTVFLTLISSLFVLAVAFPVKGNPILSRWHWLSDLPIISPRGNTWESAGTFNPAVIVRDGTVVMLYRAQDNKGTSRLGYAESTDGIHFTRHPEPVLSPEADYEKMVAWKTRDW